MRHLTARTTILSAVAALLLVAAGCAGTTDDGDGATSADTQRQSELLVSAFHLRGEADPVGLLIGHTPGERWSYELATFERDSRTRRQGQMGDNPGQSVPAPTLTKQFIASSGASARFGSSATSGAHSRFIAHSGASARFHASSGATSQFQPSALEGGAGRCEMTTVCSYFDAVCESYPSYNGFDCDGEFVTNCRKTFSRATLRRNLEQPVCFFSATFSCAARGVRNYGPITSDFQLRQAISQGLQSCRVDADLDTEFTFSTNDSSEN